MPVQPDSLAVRQGVGAVTAVVQASIREGEARTALPVLAADSLGIGIVGAIAFVLLALHE